MSWTFKPDEIEIKSIEVPFLEDARSDDVQFHTSRKSVEAAKAEVADVIGKLGASVTRFVDGTYESDSGVGRFGYAIYFQYGGVDGVIRVACLPIRKYTDAKGKQVRVQALLNVALWLRSAVSAQIFSPGTDVLLPYLLVDGDQTVADKIRAMGTLPERLHHTRQLGSGV